MNIQIKTVLKNILLVFFSLCFAILFIEVILRITGSTPKKYLDISKNEPVTNEKNETLGWSPIIGIHNFKPWAENGKNTVLTFNNDTSRFISDQKENLEKIVFVGGSFVNHGGQNPLEPVRHGCFVLYGPYVNNFKHIYNYLDKNKLSKKVGNIQNLNKKIKILFKNFLKHFLKK